MQVRDQYGRPYDLVTVELDELQEYLDREDLVGRGWVWFGGEGGSRVYLVSPRDTPATDTLSVALSDRPVDGHRAQGLADDGRAADEIPPARIG